MKLAVISFSQAGEKLAQKLSAIPGWEVTVSTKSKYAAEPLSESLSQWTQARFADCGAILFIGACGIAVRAIAPFIQSKKTDPAVLVADDAGKHVISLLSGHLGGANELTLQIAALLGAEPVITTATDNHGKLSPDVFAQKNHCAIGDMKMAKELAADLLSGRKAGLFSRFPTDQNSSAWGLEEQEGWQGPGIVISPFVEDAERFAEELWLIPEAVYMGIGCKKNIPEEKIRAAAEDAVEKAGIDWRALAGAATIDLKKEEAGLLAFCERETLPLSIFTAEELSRVPGAFSPSDFVKKVTGVDNVCERSALAAAGAGRVEKNQTGEKNEEEPQLLLRKFCRDGVTIALAMKKWRIRF